MDVQFELGLFGLDLLFFFEEFELALAGGAEFFLRQVAASTMYSTRTSFMSPLEGSQMSA